MVTPDEDAHVDDHVENFLFFIFVLAFLVNMIVEDIKIKLISLIILIFIGVISSVYRFVENYSSALAHSPDEQDQLNTIIIESELQTPRVHPRQMLAITPEDNAIHQSTDVSQPPSYDQVVASDGLPSYTKAIKHIRYYNGLP
jgi:hypothetical protein